MKKIASLIVLCMIVQLCLGQQQFVGFRVGAASTHISINVPDFPAQSKIGPTAAILYDYFLRERVSIGADVMWQPGGYRLDLQDLSGPAGDPVWVIIDFGYLALPLKASLHTLGKTRRHGQAALVLAWLVRA